MELTAEQITNFLTDHGQLVGTLWVYSYGGSGMGSAVRFVEVVAVSGLKASLISRDASPNGSLSDTGYWLADTFSFTCKPSAFIYLGTVKTHGWMFPGALVKRKDSTHVFRVLSIRFGYITLQATPTALEIYRTVVLTLDTAAQDYEEVGFQERTATRRIWDAYDDSLSDAITQGMRPILFPETVVAPAAPPVEEPEIHVTVDISRKTLLSEDPFR